MPGAPENWQHLVMEALADFRKAGPVYGIALPDVWKGELSAFMRDGQLNKMFGLKRVSFGTSKKVELVRDPTKPVSKPEKTEKSER